MTAVRSGFHDSSTFLLIYSTSMNIYKAERPPRNPGFAYLEIELPGESFEDSLRITHAMGYKVGTRGGWKYVPESAIGPIKERLASWKQDAPAGFPGSRDDYVNLPSDAPPLRFSDPVELPEFVPGTAEPELPPASFSDPDGWPDGAFGPAPLVTDFSKGTLPVSTSPPPATEGFACLQVAFPDNFRTAEHIARTLGFQVKIKSDGWIIVPSAAVQAVQNTLAAWTLDMQAPRSVTRDHISCRLIDERFGLSLAVLAQRIGAPVKKPSESEDEYFVRMDDLPLLLNVSRSLVPQPDGLPKNGPGTEQSITDWIHSYHLDGLTARQARARKLL
jgi:hypothetical protein